MVEERRIHPALEAAAGIAGKPEDLAGAGDPLGRKISDFEEDVRRRSADARVFAAHDPADVVDPLVVGDDGHEWLKDIFLLVEREHCFAFARGTRGEAAGQLRDVIRVGRPAEVQHYVIGDVHECRDRSLAGGLEASLHPLGRRAVLHPANRAAEEGGTAFRVLDPDRHRTGEAALDLRHRERLQLADPGGGEVARNSAHAHAVLPVGGDVYIEDGVFEAGICRECRSHRRICRQFDDAAVVLSELELARRAHHPPAFHAADGRDFERQVASRHVSTRRAEHAKHAGMRIGRTAHDLDVLAGPRVHGQHLQLVGLRVLLSGQHLSDAERRQCFCRI